MEKGQLRISKPPTLQYQRISIEVLSSKSTINRAPIMTACINITSVLWAMVVAERAAYGISTFQREEVLSMGML